MGPDLPRHSREFAVNSSARPTQWILGRCQPVRGSSRMRATSHGRAFSPKCRSDQFNWEHSQSPRHPKRANLDVPIHVLLPDVQWGLKAQRYTTSQNSIKPQSDYQRQTRGKTVRNRRPRRLRIERLFGLGDKSQPIQNRGELPRYFSPPPDETLRRFIRDRAMICGNG
jgi:hypothetical protein